MLNYNDLKKGLVFVLEGAPYEVLDYEFLRMQQRKPVAKTKIKNLITGKIVERNFHQNESFEEGEIEKGPIKYLYSHRDAAWFCDPENPAARFSLPAATLPSGIAFLVPNTLATAWKFEDKIINLELPIKVDLRVKEAPPGIRGDTAQGGTKQVTLETGATVNAPLFVNAGDLVRVNTSTGAYVERMEKG